MPSVEGLRFAYVLHPLPPAGFGFRRWRWELWHGASLLAAGWRTSPNDAEAALQRFAARAAHRMFGLAPRELATAGRLTPGAVHRLDTGAVTCLLVPRALEAELVGALPAA